MPKRPSAESIADELAKHDEKLRLKGEEEVLAKARSLTNGHAGDAKVQGDVTLWQTEELIEQGKMLRFIASIIPYLQAKESCVLNHTSRKWYAKAFGMSFAMPMSVAVAWAGFILWQGIKKQFGL